MNAWQDFIATQKPQAFLSDNSLCALSGLGILFVGGDDALEFLQNQLSNDIRQIDAQQAQISSFSNAKGRLLGIFRVIQIDGGYLLLMPQSIVGLIQETLQKFIIRSQVVLADISGSFASFSLSSNRRDDLNTEIYPQQVNQVFQSDSLISIRLHAFDNQQRFLFLTNDEHEAISLWQELATHYTVTEDNAWRLQEIRSGIPTLYPQTMEAFVLQMCNLNLIDGVNFKKGCYPGQEVVARMQYLGKLKRRMYLARVSTPDCPQPADELKTRQSEKPDGSGKVVDAAQIDDKTCLMLFVAQIAKAEAGELVLSAQPGAKIELLSLPYAFAD